jgi:hypothetical protein
MKIYKKTLAPKPDRCFFKKRALVRSRLRRIGYSAKEDQEAKILFFASFG